MSTRSPFDLCFPGICHRYASAIFCFYADNAADLGTFQAVVLTISFFFALLGALTSSFVTGPCCAKRVPKDVNLKLVQWLCLVIIVGICFIYAAEKLQGSPSTIGALKFRIACKLEQVACQFCLHFQWAVDSVF